MEPEVMVLPLFSSGVMTLFVLLVEPVFIVMLDIGAVIGPQFILEKNGFMSIPFIQVSIEECIIFSQDSTFDPSKAHSQQ